MGNRAPMGMSYDERMALLREEEMMAQEREERERGILEEQERQRLAREEAQRAYEQLEETERLAELERMETEGAEVSQEIEEEVDVDSSVAGLFSALAKGTGFTESPTETSEYKRPE